MPKYKRTSGEEYNIPQDQVETFMSTYPDAVEITDEIQEPVTEGKTNDVATVDAAVTSEPDTASESTELESVDTSGELQPGEQGYYRQEKRKEKEAKEQVELDNKNKLKQLTSNLNEYDRRLDSIVNTKYGKVNPKNLATQASVDLYNDLIEKRNNTIKEIDNINSGTKDKSNWERFSFLDDAGKRFKSSLKSIEQGLTRIPTFVNEVKFSILKPFLSEEDQEKFNDLNAEEQQAFVNRLGSAQQQAMSSLGIATIPVDAQKSLEKSEEARLKLEDLESELVQFENTIGQDIAAGNLGRAVTRTASQAIGAIPSLVQAFIPYVGIPSIVAGEAAKASGEAQRKGEDIGLKTIGYSSVIGASEGLLEIFTKKLGKNVFKSLVNSPKEVVEKNIKDVVLNVSKSAGGEGLSESGTLTINNMADAVILKDEKAFDNYMLDLVDTFIIGAAVGGPLRGTGEAGGLLKNAAEARSVNKELKESQYKNLTEAFKDPTVDEGTVKLSENKFTEKFLDFDLKQKLNSGDITTEQAAEIKTNFIQTQGATNSLKPLNLSTTDRAEVIELSKEKKSLENTIKQVDDKALTEPQDQRVKEINELLRGYSARAKAAETAKIGKAISQLEKVGIQTLSTEEIQNYLQNNNLVKNQEDAIKKSGEGAFIVQNPDTQEQEIIVNKDIGSISDPSHEGLHALIFQTVRKSPDTARRLGESLQEQLNKVDPNLIEDSGIRERLELYNQDPTAVQMEEVLTLFSDTVRNGTVKFNDSTFTKIGDFIRQFLSSLGVKAKFNNGRDVYNFIKDYNKSIESGKLTRGQVRAAKEGVRGKLVGPKIETFVETPTIKESKIYQEVETFKDDLVNEQTKDATTFLIADKLQNEVDRRLKIDVDQETREDIIRNFLFDDRRGLLGLLQGYDPARNESIMGYLNSSTPGGKLLDARLIEFYENDPRYNQIVQSTTDESVQRRAEQVTAEEVVTETAVKPEAKAIDPFRIMPNVKETATAEVQKSIADKDVDVTEVTYKELKDVAPYQTVADFFNIPVSRIKNPKDNLRKSDDVANIQRWILKNEPTLKNLFTEANRDVIEVTEGNRVIRQGGEPTAIPRNLLNKFYTKGDRVGNNFQWKLKPYDRTTFLEAVGIKDGKVDPNFTPRAAEAQTIKGILDMYTRNLGNVAARNIIEGREDIAPAEKARVQAEVAKGKPRIMMAKAAKQAAVDEINQFIENQEFVKTEDELAAENKVWKFIAKQLGITPISSKNADDVVEFQQWVKNVLAPRIDKSFFTTGTFANAGTSAAKRNFYFTSAQELNDLLEGVQFGSESKNIQRAVNRKTYVTGGAEGVVSKKFVKEFNSPEFKKEQQEKLDGLKEVFTVFQELMQEDSNNAKFVIALLTSTSQGMGHFVRTSAPVKFYSKNIDGGIVEEHTMPASLVAKYLFGQAVNGTIDQGFKPIENNYFQGALGKNDDKKLKGKKPNGKPFNYTSMTPEGWTLNDNIWARYFNVNVATNNFGIDPNDIVLSTGRTVFETFGVNNSGGLVSNNFNTEQQKAAQINNNKVPKNFRVMASKSMPGVLNNMSNLDTEAKRANKEFYDSVDLNKEFNDILEVKTGIASEKRYKRVKAEVVGANKGRFQFFIPPSAEDFVGLLYSTLAKGKLGDAQMAWYKKNLLDPYGKAMNELSSARIAMMNDYKALKKELKLVPKDLRKKVPGEPFTQEQAVRVYIWQKQGITVPGISETDMQELSEFVEGKEDLKTFADQLMYIQKGDQYAGPKEGWPAGTITTDMLEGLNTTKRAKALEQWQANADEIFSEANLNKLEAAYGKPYRKAMENMLQRMKSGRNRNFQGDTLTGRFTDWVTGSIGTIMFFNTRSALLQTISSINFVNFTDNNVLAAGKAFANQKQFWSDFMTLMNSDFLKERRGGLRINVSEADIADMAKKGGAKGVINKLLEFGFTPTQIADSFAIASGGATFYRNRIKSLKKQGMTDAEAEAQAFVDFRETAEESQQSSRPDRISMQQAGPLGRLVLAFANTPAQYARLIKKAASDLKNGRGDAKTNISKIIYYGVAQNLLFNALQQALFAFAFDDNEEDTDEQQKKYVSIANGMMDSLLRGMGIGGAAVSVGKNAIIRIINEMEKKQPKLEKVGYELTKLSPPISAKLSRVNQAARSYQWDKKEMMEKGWSLDNPAYLAGANVIAALTNVPLDRAVKKTNNVVQATSQDLETWERLALLGGWQDWEIGIDEEKPSNKPQPRKSTSKYKKSKIK